MKITSKGQCATRSPIRSEQGTDVVVVSEGGKMVSHAKSERHHPADCWLEKATGVARGKITTAKIMNLTRGED